MSQWLQTAKSKHYSRGKIVLRTLSISLKFGQKVHALTQHCSLDAMQREKWSPPWSDACVQPRSAIPSDNTPYLHSSISAYCHSIELGNAYPLLCKILAILQTTRQAEVNVGLVQRVFWCAEWRARLWSSAWFSSSHWVVIIKLSVRYPLKYGNARWYFLPISQRFYFAVTHTAQ